MKQFYVALVSEFYKSRKTLAFWAAILLPILICGSIALGYYSNAEKILKFNYPGMILWGQFSGASLNIMGLLILPFYVIFMAFSINNIEHKNDTWKTLFSQPLNKFSIYAAKYAYAVSLIFICLLLFFGLTYLSGYLLQVLVPEYTFKNYNPSIILSKFYARLFFSSLGILSIQFILSLIWSDFLKPMGIGFVGTIIGIIAANVQWKYAQYIAYAIPTITLRSTKPKGSNPEDFQVFTNDIYISIAYGILLFIIGYFILTKKNIK